MVNLLLIREEMRGKEMQYQKLSTTAIILAASMEQLAVISSILFPKHVIIENWMLKLMSILKPIMKHLNLNSMPISKLEFLAFWTYVEGADKKWIDVAMSSINEITDVGLKKE